MSSLFGSRPLEDVLLELGTNPKYRSLAKKIGMDLRVGFLERLDLKKMYFRIEVPRALRRLDEVADIVQALDGFPDEVSIEEYVHYVLNRHKVWKRQHQKAFDILSDWIDVDLKTKLLEVQLIFGFTPRVDHLWVRLQTQKYGILSFPFVIRFSRLGYFNIKRLDTNTINRYTSEHTPAARWIDALDRYVATKSYEVYKLPIQIAQKFGHAIDMAHIGPDLGL